MASKKISVITPVLNGARFIESCLRNVSEQGCLGEIEHLILDGGSSDETVAIVRRFAGQHPHVRLVSEKDRGQSDAMNKGVLLASGGILGFLNVDDFYEPGALRAALDLFEELPEPALLVGNCNIWGDDGKFLGLNKPAHLEITALLTGDESRFPFPVNPSAYFYHKSLHDVIGMYDVDEQFVLDLDFILRATMYRKPVYVDRIFGNYRYLEGTKTFEDMKTGSTRERTSRLLRKYRTHLGFRQRVEVWFSLTVGKALHRARGLVAALVHAL